MQPGEDTVVSHQQRRGFIVPFRESPKEWLKSRGIKETCATCMVQNQQQKVQSPKDVGSEDHEHIWLWSHNPQQGKGCIFSMLEVPPPLQLQYQQGQSRLWTTVQQGWEVLYPLSQNTRRYVLQGSCENLQRQKTRNHWTAWSTYCDGPIMQNESSQQFVQLVSWWTIASEVRYWKPIFCRWLLSSNPQGIQGSVEMHIEQIVSGQLGPHARREQVEWPLLDDSSWWPTKANTHLMVLSLDGRLLHAKRDRPSKVKSFSHAV